MEKQFLEGYCPKCGGELHVPADMERIICMYCGESFDRSELCMLRPVSSRDIEDDTQKVELGLPHMLDGHERLMERFEMHTYKAAFEEYKGRNRDFVEAFCRSAAREEDPDSYISQKASLFLAAVVREINGKKEGKGRADHQVVMQHYVMVMTVYCVPMLIDFRMPAASKLADQIVKQWAKLFPKYTFKKGTFEIFNKSFRKTVFCFITSAVCRSLGRGDDCPELNAFRRFRDEILMKMPGGPEDIAEYYRIAPPIVEAIDRRADADEIYRGIWEDYLAPCLEDIHSENYGSCRMRYTSMVRTLREEYMTVSVR